jgi:hypothetical protein
MKAAHSNASLNAIVSPFYILTFFILLGVEEGF